MQIRTILFIILYFLAIGTAIAQKSDRILKKLPQEDGILYFLSAESFKSKQPQATLLPDFTFFYRPNGSVQDSVTVHFTIFHKKKAEKLDRISWTWQGGSLPDCQPNLMFIEKKGKKWVSRYSIHITPQAFLSLIQHPESLKVSAFDSSSKFDFQPGKKWKKNATLVHQILSMEVKL